MIKSLGFSILPPLLQRWERGWKWSYYLFMPTWGMGLPRRCSGKESACQCRRHEFDPRWGRSPGGNGNPLQYSCLENPMDRGAWQVTVHGLQRVGHNWATDHMPTWGSVHKIPTVRDSESFQVHSHRGGDSPQLHRNRGSCAQDPPRPQLTNHFICLFICITSFNDLVNIKCFPEFCEPR